MRWRRRAHKLIVALGLLALTACETAPPDKPQTQIAPAPVAAIAPTGPSAKSQQLTRYYGRLQDNLLAQGLLRTDGGGPDTPYTDTDLLRNFERIAFRNEYQPESGLKLATDEGIGLLKWVRPVRMDVEFGASVPDTQRAVDRARVEKYAARLARVTNHPITMAKTDVNFYVLVMGEDDREQLTTRVRQIAPEIGTVNFNVFERLPRSVECLVATFAGPDSDSTYIRAIALIRAEHPDLTRRACIHEELAQGLGLTNDSPNARPSIFNDDSEFALLTTHDEELLRLLYNPALTSGMSVEQARPIARRLLAARNGGTM